MSDTRIIGYLNPFVTPGRLEIVIDWGDDWYAMDPFVDATFMLAVTAQPSDAPVYNIKLDPVVVPEVREQLALAGQDAADVSGQLAGIDRLAPAWVCATAKQITGPLPPSTQGADPPPSSAQSMADLTRNKPQLFPSPNVMADLRLWHELPDPVVRKEIIDGTVTIKTAKNSFRDALTKTLKAVGNTLKSVKVQVEDVTNDPQLFLQLLTESGLKARSDATALAQATLERMGQEQFAYAEALRRDGIYSRIVGEQVPPFSAIVPVFTSRIRDKRADVRRVSRDEWVVGAMFHALRAFSIPAGADNWKGSYIWIAPFKGNQAIAGYQAVPTLVDSYGGRTITVLRRDLTPTYFGKGVVARQLATSLLPDETLLDFDPMVQLRTLIETGQTGLPKRHRRHLLANSDPADSAYDLNNQAHLPTGIALNYIDDDWRREMADAAESIRSQAPPHDTIGITWDRALTASATDSSSDTAFHTGFKGYRIDAREVAKAQPAAAPAWTSLCTVEREVVGNTGESIVRARSTREGYVTQPVQNHSAEKGKLPTVLTMPTDFVLWAGGSAVVAHPLDRLGRGSDALAGMEGALVVLREEGTTTLYPRYGRQYEFRIRGAGLSGVGPDSMTDPNDGARAAVDFKRAIWMDAPPVSIDYHDLLPLGRDGKVDSTSRESTPDGNLIVSGHNPYIEIHTSVPVAHWRVAIHSRGLKRDDLDSQQAERFERACQTLVQRCRNNWRRRNAGMGDQNENRPAAHLSAVDPDCGAIEVVARAWFPFSSNPNADRMYVIGRGVADRPDIRLSSFSQLVVWAEDLIERDHPHDRSFLVRFDDATLPEKETPDNELRMLAGFHCALQVTALWSDNAVTHYKKGEGRRTWTRQIFAANHPHDRRPVGGRDIARSIDFKAGEAALVQNAISIDAAYAGLASVQDERDLVMPQPAATNAPVCDIPPSASRAHAEPIKWRKNFFDAVDDCSARAIYRAFVAQQLGDCITDGSQLTPEGQENHQHDLVASLLPRVVKRGGTTLVTSVFSLPAAVNYDPAAQLADRTQTIVAKLGEFGVRSDGVASIEMTNGGTGYDPARPPKVIITGTGTHAAARVSRIEPVSGAILSVIIDCDGEGYTSASVSFDTTGTTGTGAAANAIIGPEAKRRLPWVDYDITWLVRLAWSVPLTHSLIARPLELVAVKEFHLFRCDKLKDEPSSLRAVLTRPGRDVLESVNLDEVEFTWVDAVDDRDHHEYEYSIVAVPEDPNTFEEREWFHFNVSVPDSHIAALPESARFLPLRAEQGVRAVAVYFSDDDVRRRNDVLSFRYAHVADDPMLPIAPRTKSKGGRRAYQPQNLTEVFPATRTKVTRVEEWNDSLIDGYRAPLLDANAHDPDRRDRLFVVATTTPEGKLIWPTSGTELGNPFFKLDLQAYDRSRFPALQHTAGSELLESGWLQFYPDTLAWSDKAGELKIVSPWGTSASSAKENLIWYRYHFFARATDTLSIHVSTFYTQSPELTPTSGQVSEIKQSYAALTGAVPATLETFVRAEEGLLAQTYGLDLTDTTDPRAKTDSDQRFVVLRSTDQSKPFTVQ